MKKKAVKKLELSKETVANLFPIVVGGVSAKCTPTLLTLCETCSGGSYC
jgi:hypothetical protein